MLRLADGTLNVGSWAFVLEGDTLTEREQQCDYPYEYPMGNGNGTGLGYFAWLDGDGSSATHRPSFAINHSIALLVNKRAS